MKMALAESANVIHNLARFSCDCNVKILYTTKKSCVQCVGFRICLDFLMLEFKLARTVDGKRGESNFVPFLKKRACKHKLFDSGKVF